MSNLNDVPRQVAILDADLHVEASNCVAFIDRLPIEIENQVRKLATSWDMNVWNYPERHCVLSGGLLMRVFFLLGSERFRLAVTLEPYYEAAGET